MAYNSGRQQSQGIEEAYCERVIEQAANSPVGSRAAHTAHKHIGVHHSDRKQPLVRIKEGNVDYAVSVVVTVLVLFGVIMVFSASYYNASSARYQHDTLMFVRSQTRAALVGFAAMIFMSSVNYKYLKKASVLLFFVTSALLVLVQIVGEEVNGAKRWFEIPVFGSLQPSEIAKISLILFLSYMIARKKQPLDTWGDHIACMFFVGITAGLVFLGSLSTAIVVFAIGFSIVFIASPYVLRFILFAAGGAGAAGLFVFFGEAWRYDRVQAWLNPENYASDLATQALQSLYAIGAGGIAGLGPGQSRQKMGILPEPHNDFIFSIICEELGVMGAAFVIILFVILIWRGVRISMKATDTFGSLVAAGIVVMIAAQVIINIAVVTNTIPTTGVPLPFISYGGTSLAITMFSMGILLNISRYTKEGYPK